MLIGPFLFFKIDLRGLYAWRRLQMDLASRTHPKWIALVWRASRKGRPVIVGDRFFAPGIKAPLWLGEWGEDLPPAGIGSFTVIGFSGVAIVVHAGCIVAEGRYHSASN